MSFTLARLTTSDRLPDEAFAFTAGTAAEAAAWLLEASPATFVALTAPYHDPDAGGDVMTLLEGRRAGDRIWGTWVTRPLEGGRPTRGRFEARRARTPKG